MTRGPGGYAVGMRRLFAALVAVPSLLLVTAPAADAAPRPVRYKNCAALNKVYKHGVGKPGARDKVSRGKAVTTFTRSAKVYALNTHLDRDRDRIACEER